VRGERSAVMVMSQGQRRLTSHRSTLHILRTGNRAVVSSLDLAYCGVTFQYATHFPPQIEERQASTRPSDKPGAVIAQATVVDVPIMVSGQ
jgi:hypothetical protein